MWASHATGRLLGLALLAALLVALAAVPGSADIAIDPDRPPLTASQYIDAVKSIEAAKHDDAIEGFIAEASDLPGVLSVAAVDGGVDVVHARGSRVTASAVGALIPEQRSIDFDLKESCVRADTMEIANAGATSQLELDRDGFVSFGYSQQIDRIVVTTNMDPEKVVAQLGVAPKLVTVVHAPEATLSRLLGPPTRSW